MEKQYYTIKEVAKRLGLVEQTIRNYISDGTIKSEKFFYSTVISKEELERYEDLRNKGR